MTAANLAVIFGPNLLQKERGTDVSHHIYAMGIEDSTAIINVTLVLVQNYRRLFTVGPSTFHTGKFNSTKLNMNVERNKFLFWFGFFLGYLEVENVYSKVFSPNEQCCNISLSIIFICSFHTLNFLQIITVCSERRGVFFVLFQYN